MEVDRKSFHKLALGLMTIGYIWLWFFNRNPHVLIKFLTMQSYFLVWLYFLMQTLNKNDISGYSMDRLFENNFVFQVFMVTPAYWVLIHGPMVDSKRFPCKYYVSVVYQVLWNAYVHIVPVILIVTEFFWSKKQFQKDNWKDTACFYFLFAWPINLSKSIIMQSTLTSTGLYISLSYTMMLMTISLCSFWDQLPYLCIGAAMRYINDGIKVLSQSH